MSGARTKLTECMIGRIVKMIPFMNQLRYYMEDNQVLIMVCLILYNLKRTYIIIGGMMVGVGGQTQFGHSELVASN